PASSKKSRRPARKTRGRGLRLSYVRFALRWIREGEGEKMSWLQKLLPPKSKRVEGATRKQVPEGLWTKCPSCDAVLYATDLEKNLNVCPKCGHHQRISARLRLEALLDEDGRFKIGAEVLRVDSLNFKDSRRYPE